MSKNRVLKRLTREQTFVVPGGVTQIRASVYRQLRFDQIASAGSSNTVGSAGISSGGDLWVWGNNSNGFLGLNDLTARSRPVLHPTRRKWKQIGGGDSHFIALDQFGDAYTWGGNLKGQLGDGTVVAKSNPVLVPGNLKWRQISAGFSQSAGITTEGDLYIWGGNSSGEIGNNTNVAVSAPVLIASGTKFQQIQMYSGFACAIREDGVGMSWGYDYFGGLGSGATLGRSTPTVITGSPVFKRLFPSRGPVFAIDHENRGWAWGSNGQGQAGVGTQVDVSTPTLISGNRKWRSLVGVGSNSGGAGVTLDGDLFWWGDGYNNNASGGITNAVAPQPAAGSRKYRSVAGTNGGHTYATSNDGRLWGWGRDDSGSFGFGNGANQVASSPVVVASGVQFRPLDMELVSDQIIDVTPGTSMPLKLWTGAISMGDQILSEPVDAPLVVLEYFA